ncbi:ABC transporter substrate-binding protein [Mesorhizobium sp. B4-1-3]|uniref:ABC transporter substrate-binding protein n=1 Tax=Mesorhizobium sp. B4-1-3 TaxID=2589889 RepID=UPI0011281869|nr:ABC transporter substrate-binding protein [Mesorhizobium sp. B4-1-3]TPI12471.1 ABC transporter substrate-binding protein [Mesorhizobium sp. B4-1-3]
MSTIFAPASFLKSAIAATLLSSTAILATAHAADFRLGVRADALTIDPIASSDNSSIWLELQVYDQLVRPSKDGSKLEPAIAESWTISPDGKEFTFKLRPEAKFSDGQPVTAADVAFSLQRAAGEKSEWARFFKPITSYQVVDDHTIVMKLDKPFTPILNNLALFSASILPAKLVQQQGDKFFEHPIGSGPFVLKSWTRGQGEELTKNPNYWEKNKPSIDAVSIEVVPEDNSRVLKLKAGELDAITDVPYNQAANLKTDADIDVHAAPVFRVDLVQLNTTKKPFDNESVRQALNYALDKEAIVKGILRGNAKPTTSSIPVMAYHNEKLKPYPVDLAKAKELLAKGGVPDGFKTSMLVAAGDVTARQVASAIQASLRKVGVEVALQTIEDSSQFSTTKSGNYEMSLSYATSDTIDPDQLVGFTAVNPERANAFHTQWKSDRVNQLYADERQTPDGPERAKQFQEIEAVVHEQAPFIFLYTPNSAYANRKNVSGFEVVPTANYVLKDVVVK